MGHVAVIVECAGTWQESLLIFHGGLSEDKVALQDMAVLQLGAGSWLRPQPVKPGPPARSFHCGAALSSSLYIFGGHVWHRDTREIRKFHDLWRLDTESWSWEKVEPQKGSRQPAPRDFASMLALDGDRLLLFGGLDAADRRLDDVWLFDEAKGAWAELHVAGAKPRARYGHSMSRMGSRLLMLGGDIGTGYAADLWTLRGLEGGSEEAPAWIQLDLPGQAPSPRKGHCLAAQGPLLVVMGGRMLDTGWFRSRAGAFLNDVVLMGRDAQEQRVAWQTPHLPAPLPAPREFHTLTLLPSHRLLLFGGGSGKQVFGDAWYLDLGGEIGDPQSLSLGSSEAGSSPHFHSSSNTAPQRLYGRDPKSLQPQGIWWAGSKGASAFNGIRQQLGLGAFPSAATSSRHGAKTAWMPHGGAAAAGRSSSMLQQESDFQDVRLEDIADVSKAHAALCSRRAQQEMKQRQQSGQDFSLLADCLSLSSCASHIKPTDLQLRDVEFMITELQNQLVT
ncbi:hypothetical protein WJX74_001325 [Apatococcus lobatus]|uniref:Uncharacterized protein n=1 Tax=Apatococcus lobatus TaxID=904363 RepID=A0AAW1S654_9CHLO